MERKRYRLVMEEDKEVTPPHPWCPLCDMLVLCKILNEKHRHIEQFNWGAEQKRRRLAVEEEREVTVRAFSAYGRPLDMVTSFRYLGQGISEVDDN